MVHEPILKSKATVSLYFPPDVKMRTRQTHSKLEDGEGDLARNGDAGSPVQLTNHLPIIRFADRAGLD